MSDHEGDLLILCHDDFGCVPIDELSVIGNDGRYIWVLDQGGVEAKFELGPYVTSGETYDPKNQPWYCGHPETEVRFRVKSNGVEFAKPQCLSCGRSAGGELKKIHWPAHRRQWDESIENEWKSRVEFIQNCNLLRRAANWQKQSKEKSDAYASYLRSDEWRERRRKVLARDGGICRGCLVNKATQVHHLTYEHIYDELLFELVSVCDECHRKAHPDKDM